jgi:predicted Zn-dependent protease
MPIMSFPNHPSVFCGSPSGAGARVGWAKEAWRVFRHFVGHAMSDAVGGNSSRFKRLRVSFRVADRSIPKTRNVRSGQAVGLIVVLAAVLGIAASASAQPRLAAPDEVVIYLHASMKETDFADGLVCELGRVLVAPVRATTIDLPLTQDYLATPSQFHSGKMMLPFARATAGEPGRVFRYLILDRDLKVDGLNYVFSETSLAADPVAVMSIIRLKPNAPGLSRKRVSDVTGDRLYKLMLKSIAILAGLRTGGCVMAFPRSLPELDAKAAEFCPADRTALVDAGVLKAKPFGACNTVAMAGR